MSLYVLCVAAVTVWTAFFRSTAECLVHLSRARVQLAKTASTGRATIVAETTSPRGCVPTSANSDAITAPFRQFLSIVVIQQPREAHWRRWLGPLRPPLAPLPLPMATLAAWVSKVHRRSVKPLSFVCRIEGGDASKGMGDTVMSDGGASGPAPGGSTLYAAAENEESDKVEVRHLLKAIDRF